MSELGWQGSATLWPLQNADRTVKQSLAISVEPTLMHSAFQDGFVPGHLKIEGTIPSNAAVQAADNVVELPTLRHLDAMRHPEGKNAPSRMKCSARRARHHDESGPARG